MPAIAHPVAGRDAATPKPRACGGAVTNGCSVMRVGAEEPVPAPKAPRPSRHRPANAVDAEPTIAEDERATRLDLLIVDAEQRVGEQAFLYESMQADGQDTRQAMRALRAFEDILVELVRARTLIRSRLPPGERPDR